MRSCLCTKFCTTNESLCFIKVGAQVGAHWCSTFYPHCLASRAACKGSYLVIGARRPHSRSNSPSCGAGSKPYLYYETGQNFTIKVKDNLLFSSRSASVATSLSKDLHKRIFSFDETLFSFWRQKAPISITYPTILS